MNNTKKIIIFLTPLSNEANPKHRNTLINNYCLQNNFIISQILENKGSFHHTNLRKLIDEIKSEPKGTFTVLIEDAVLNDPNSIVLISILGTLYLLGLINTEIYAKSYKKIKLYDAVQQQNDFLSIADFCLHYTLECYKDKNNDLKEKLN